MKRLGAIVLLAVWACAAVPAAAQLEQRLPADSWLYVKWAGRSLTFDGSLCGQMLQDPEVANLLGFVRSLVDEKAPNDRDREAFGHVWKGLGIVWQHPICLAMGGPLEPGGCFGVLLIDLGTDKEAFQTELEAAIAMIPEEERQKNLQTVTEGAVTYRTIPTPAGPLAFGFLSDSNVFFLTVGADQAKALLERTPDRSLTANAKFVECMKALEGENMQAGLYVDVEKTLLLAEEQMRPTPPATSAPASAPAVASQPAVSEFRRIIDALGIGKLQAVAGTVRVVDKGMYTKIRLFTPAPHEGLLMPLAGAGLTEADLADVPADADLAVAVNLSPKAMLDEIRRVAEKIDPQAPEAIAAGLATAQQMTGVDLEGDILASLGDTWVLSFAPSQGGPIVGAMLTVEIKDEPKLQAAIDKLLALVNPAPPAEASGTQPASQPVTGGPAVRPPFRPVQIQTTKAGDVEIRYVRILQGDIGLAFLPAWSIYKGKLHLALWPQVIASAVENQTPPLTNGPEFKAARGKVAPDVSILTYVNTPEIMKKLYPLQLIFGTLATNAIGKEVRTDQPIPLWPGSLNSVLKYLMPQAGAVSHDEKGITFEGYGTGPSLAPAVPLAVSVLLPALNRTRQTAKRAVSMTNLNGIGKCVIIYQAEYQDKLPPNLAALVEAGMVPPKMLVSPVSGKQPPTYDKENKKIVGPIDYIYLYNEKGSLPGDTLLVYEDPANYGQTGTYVLFADAHTAWVNLAEFQRLLEDAKSKGGKVAE